MPEQISAISKYQVGTLWNQIESSVTKKETWVAKQNSGLIKLNNNFP